VINTLSRSGITRFGSMGIISAKFTLSTPYVETKVVKKSNISSIKPQKKVQAGSLGKLRSLGKLGKNDNH
jgi:hypothetical protein